MSPTLLCCLMPPTSPHYCRKNSKPFDGIKYPPQSDPSLSPWSPPIPPFYWPLRLPGIVMPSHAALPLFRGFLSTSFSRIPPQPHLFSEALLIPVFHITIGLLPVLYPHHIITPPAFFCYYTYKHVSLPTGVLVLWKWSHFSVTFASFTFRTEPGI